MELLLNLTWGVLALGALIAFCSARCGPTEGLRVPYLRALLALGCVVFLLFPIVSASDDLHPTQAVFEDASKRVSRGGFTISPVSGAPTLFLPALILSLLLAIAALWADIPEIRFAPASEGKFSPQLGRAPPLL